MLYDITKIFNSQNIKYKQPFNDAIPYDMILYLKNKKVKVQLKNRTKGTIKNRNNRYRCILKKSFKRGGDRKWKTYDSCDFDILIVHLINIKQYCIVPMSYLIKNKLVDQNDVSGKTIYFYPSDKTTDTYKFIVKPSEFKNKLLQYV